jgi:hypothetical protein
MFINSTEEYGWSEHYEYLGQQTDIPALTTYFQQMVTARAFLLTADCTIVWLRLETNFKRDPLIWDFENYPPAKGRVAGSYNTQEDALIVRSEATGIGYNRIFMRGISDAYIDGDQFNPDPQWVQNFQAYRTFLMRLGNFGVKSAVDNPQNPVECSRANQGVPRGILVLTLVPNALDGFSVVRLSKAKFVGYNGIKNVVKEHFGGANNAYLLGGATPQQDNTSALFATPVVYQTGALTDFFFERITLRKAGRPFGLIRGRRQTTLPLRQ